ncbi:efflux RND transporter periplasmic adaptor subunit [Mesohalobacter halotolerans]|uniref:Efflux RND transporter periplasmic adaptor subunit n=1 Tax=Mesohalobacter halotolerans TaxID=1883405 RepID=A0A4U5TTG0_9FLAO|nr:efflux RND transporter periplasmic adaptor subunit [Mesohalobacter halotolerans]MBS3738396.1 efflux RND transporter periplasmic adaptor subunit [Psychroflexus sp.]TKS57342.1 efflux RND transporter periplasmic adaptor subunit [Mesohalobacter halotolerans]
MKKVITIIVLVILAFLFVGAVYYLYQKDQEPPVTYDTETPTKETIVKETIATGTITPREEVPVKPNISGIIDEIFVKAGDTVKVGQLIAKLKVVPNVSNLNNAKNQIRTAQINLDNETKIYNRQKELFEKGVISANDFDQAQRSFDIAKQNLESAKETFEIIETGTTAGIGDAATTEIKATISGMVLDVPVKVGNQVIEANNFNEGTTIATIANVNEMIFEGKVDESEVGKIEEGLPLEITVGAIQDVVFDATLDYVAPQGVEENGAVQFEIEGTLAKRDDNIFIRAGLSANASIILEKAEDVLAIKEALVQFDKDTKKPYVEVMVGDQEFERRDIKLGISDGINVEVVDGLSKDDKIKVWNKVEEKRPSGGRRG